MAPEPVRIIASETHIMESTHSAQTYRISVSLPLGYHSSADEAWPFDNTPEKRSVIYLTDANWYQGMVTDIIRPMSWCGSTNDAIVVGIGYPEPDEPMEAFRESFTRRNLDLTPVRDEKEEKSMEAHFKRPVPTGGAGKFLSFIKDELIPMIESNYRADPTKRIFLGHSYGGLFGAFALFEEPDLFSALIIGSPTLSYGNRFVFQQEEAFAKTNKALPVRLFLYVGDENIIANNDTTTTDTLHFAAVLENRKYEGLTFVKRVLFDHNHCEIVAPGFQLGLKFALKH